MDVAVTGSSGLIGSALVASLREGGHTVRRVVRAGSAAADRSGPVVAWDPMAGQIDAAALAGVDGVVHLAGEGIGERRWTDEQKRRILESRTRGSIPPDETQRQTPENERSPQAHGRRSTMASRRSCARAYVGAISSAASA